MRLFTNLLVVVCLSLLVADRIYVNILNYIDPFKYYSIVALTPQVPRGGVLVTKIDVHKYRVCEVWLDRFMISDVTRRVIYRDRVPGGATVLGRTPDVRNEIHVPPDAPIGGVTLLQNVHSHCIDGIHSTAAPNVYFEVIDG